MILTIKLNDHDDMILYYEEEEVDDDDDDDDDHDDNENDNDDDNDGGDGGGDNDNNTNNNIKKVKKKKTTGSSHPEANAIVCQVPHSHFDTPAGSLSTGLRGPPTPSKVCTTYYDILCKKEIIIYARRV